MTGLKAYRYLDEGVELMNELGVKCDESDLITVNSTGLSMYNPVNLADMVKGMKNKTMTREQKIATTGSLRQRDCIGDCRGQFTNALKNWVAW